MGHQCRIMTFLYYRTLDVGKNKKRKKKQGKAANEENMIRKIR